MATATKKPAVETEEYDFDSWTPEKEAAELERLASETQIKYILVEQSFVARFPDGETFKLPLALGLSVVEELEQFDGDDIAQLRHVLASFFPAEVDRLLKQDLLPVADFAQKYFQVFSKIAGARLGESGGSPA